MHSESRLTPSLRTLATLATLGVLAACTTGEGAETGNPTGDHPPATTDADAGCPDGPPCETSASATSADSGAVQNGHEPHVDCGGPGGLPRCADGERCLDASDCNSEICTGGICRPITDRDGVQNGGETDIDCGGPHPDKCAVDASCAVGGDCQSRVCDPATKKCAAPRYDDGVRNGDETDVDCGGPSAPKRCAVGRGCARHADCESDGCAADGKCAAGATCTQVEGGQTCGPNESLTRQDDCCARAKAGAYTIDKYQITAGRMRAFLARAGNVREWASKLPADRWNQAWTPLLPVSLDGLPGSPDNANTQLGPYFAKRACETGFHTGHTFWTPESYGDKKDFPQNVLDTKALNCVPWHLLAALCAFDGGHLIREPELRAAYTNAETTPYPWGQRGTYTTTEANGYAIGLWSYFTPNPPPEARRDPDGYLDVAFYIAPPGRRPLGYNASGVADLVGNVLEWVGDSERQFVWKGSFENHAREADALEAPMDNDPYVVLRTADTPWRWNDVAAMGSDPENVNGYVGLGGRCGY